MKFCAIPAFHRPPRTTTLYATTSAELGALAGTRDQGPVLTAAKLWIDVRGLDVSAALHRRLALHGLDHRSRAQACAPSSRHRESLHGQPAARRARACGTDAQP